MNTYPTPTGPRYHYMDNIRALAMIAGVFFHAAMAYNPLLSKTYVLADPYTSSIIEFVVLYAHLFRMPIFMLVAGFFAHYLLLRCGGREFVKNRTIRVFLPFVIFFPLTVAAIIAIVINAVPLVENKPAMMLFLIENVVSGKNDSQMPVSTFHLWFLYYLMIFYTCGLVWKLLSPIDITDYFKRLSLHTRTTALILVTPLLVSLSFFMQSNPPVAPADKLYPQVWASLYYGIFFLIGWVFYRTQDLFDKTKNYSITLLLISALLFIFVYRYYPSIISIESALNPSINYTATAEHAFFALLQGIIATFATLSLISLSKQYLNIQSKVMRYLADASYWLYLSHIPVVMVCHMMLIDTSLNVWIKYFLSCSVTFITCLLSYQILVRYTPIGWMLNGKQRRPIPISEYNDDPTASVEIK